MHSIREGMQSEQTSKRESIIFVATISSMVITAILALFFLLAEAAEAQTPLSSTAVFEDQFMICNFEDVCTTIDADNFMPQKSIDKIWTQFNDEVDTFDIGELD